MSRSIILIGGPDSGKTNYIGPLWRELDYGKGALHAAEQPKDINFVMEVTEHIFQGSFAPRTEHSDMRRDFEVIVATEKGGPTSKVIVPDISGELWRNAVINNEISADWMDELKQADAALLFVRVDSDQNIQPLDWVTACRLIKKIGTGEEQGLPTQVVLCELIHFLENSLTKRNDGGLPRLSVVVAAWDRVDTKMFTQGPEVYLQREYPLVAGRLADLKTLDIKVFGLSSVGGDLKNDDAYRNDFLETGPDGRGWVAVYDGEQWHKVYDLTLPIEWAVGL
ncbi:hypothetical protein WFM03_02730 [Yersinia enterocolitica]